MLTAFQRTRARACRRSSLVIVLGVLIVVSIGLLGWGFYTKLAGPDAVGGRGDRAATE